MKIEIDNGIKLDECIPGKLYRHTSSSTPEDPLLCVNDFREDKNQMVRLSDTQNRSAYMTPLLCSFNGHDTFVRYEGKVVITFNS